MLEGPLDQTEPELFTFPVDVDDEAIERRGAADKLTLQERLDPAVGQRQDELVINVMLMRRRTTTTPVVVQQQKASTTVSSCGRSL